MDAGNRCARNNPDVDFERNNIGVVARTFNVSSTESGGYLSPSDRSAAETGNGARRRRCRAESYALFISMILCLARPRAELIIYFIISLKNIQYINNNSDS